MSTESSTESRVPTEMNKEGEMLSLRLWMDSKEA